jgi:hypothetical protein
MRIFLTLIFYVLTSFSLRAEILSATTTGRTINTGINQELLTKRATANAIENFLLHNGAKIKAITIVEDGEIAFDQIRINTEHRLLGFDILQHKASTEYTEVTLKVYYGKIGPSQQCRDRKKLGIRLTGVTANLAPNAPAFLIHIKKSLHEGIKNLGADMEFVTIENGPSSVGQSKFAFDYNILAAAQTTKRETVNADTLAIKLEIMQVNGANQVNVNFHTSSSNKKLETDIGIVTANTELSMLAPPFFINRVPRSRREVMSELLTPYLHELSKVLNRISCEPVSTTLVKEGNQYRVKIGSKNGVNKNSIFLFENGQTSGFGVRKLLETETQLIPLQSIFPVEPKDGALLYLVK